MTTTTSTPVAAPGMPEEVVTRTPVQDVTLPGGAGVLAYIAAMSTSASLVVGRPSLGKENTSSGPPRLSAIWAIAMAQATQSIQMVTVRTICGAIFGHAKV